MKIARYGTSNAPVAPDTESLIAFICSASFEDSAAPAVPLSGRWLELARFEAGQQVRIEVEHGRLFNTPD
jgi:hypothetical protein